MNLVPYTEEIIVSLWGRYNEALWPLHILIGVMVALGLYRLKSGETKSKKALLLMVALFWIVCAILYYQNWLWTLTWAAPLFAAIFFFQGCVIGVTALNQPDRSFQKMGLAGWGLVALSFLYSFWAGLSVYGLKGVPIVGLGPVPIVIFTFGVLCFLRPKVALMLGFLPFLAAVFLALEGWQIGFYFDLSGVFAAGVFVMMKLPALLSTNENDDVRRKGV